MARSCRGTECLTRRYDHAPTLTHAVYVRRCDTEFSFSRLNFQLCFYVFVKCGVCGTRVVRKLIRSLCIDGWNPSWNFLAGERWGRGGGEASYPVFVGLLVTRTLRQRN